MWRLVSLLWTAATTAKATTATAAQFGHFMQPAMSGHSPLPHKCPLHGCPLSDNPTLWKCKLFLRIVLCCGRNGASVLGEVSGRGKCPTSQSSTSHLIPVGSIPSSIQHHANSRVVTSLVTWGITSHIDMEKRRQERDSPKSYSVICDLSCKFSFVFGSVSVHQGRERGGAKDGTRLHKSSYSYMTVIVTLHWILNFCNLPWWPIFFLSPNQIFGYVLVAHAYFFRFSCLT